MHTHVALAYHGVGPADDRRDPSRLVISPEHLDAQLRLLRRLGYRFLTAEGLLDELASGGPRGRTAVLTFDDGFRGWLEHAVPVLRRHGAAATFYLCPGWWGRHHPQVQGEPGRLVTREDAARLLDMGMELGSHSMVHADLRTLDDGALAADLREAREEVERVSGKRCRTFAYPFGLFGEREMRAAEAAGHELAFDWLPGARRRFGWPRLPAPPRHGAIRLGLKLLGLRRPGR